jgi:hypothetical protein
MLPYSAGSRPAASGVMNDLAEKATFATMNDAICATRAHAQKQSFSYKISHRNKHRAVFKYSGNSCNAYVRVSFSKKHEQ